MSARGLAVAQAVSRRLRTTAARVRAQVRSRGICGGQSSTGAGFLRVFQLSLPIIPLTPPGADAVPHSVNKYLHLESDHVIKTEIRGYC
jgi:hypothetical protein